MITDRDATDFVITAIEAGDASVDQYDLDAIVSEMHDIAGGWDFDSIDFVTFWNVIEKHEKAGA